MTDHHRFAATTSRALVGIVLLLALATACDSPASTGRVTTTHTGAGATTTTHSSGVTTSPAPGTVGAYLGLTNMGMPTAPQPFMSDTFAITKHARQTCGGVIDNGFGPPADGGNCSMDADHGADCSPPPASHPIGLAYRDMVFICHDHLMTSLNANGDGVIEFQPNQLIDISGGAASVSISRSTKLTSNQGRDYTQIYFVPWAEQLAYNIDGNTGEGRKEPPDYIRVTMGTFTGNFFQVLESVGGRQADVSCVDCWDSLEHYTGLVDSAVTRTPVQMSVSASHIRIAMNGHVFFDNNLPQAFPASQLLMQIQHVSYDPTKGGGGPDTWHWSDLAISRATPYYQKMAMPEATGDYSGLTNHVSFAPAPAGAFLRFQGYNSHGDSFGGGYSISFDNGATWAPWHLASSTGDKSMDSFWQSIPTGATSALLRGSSGWYARDFYVMAKGASAA